MHRALTYIATPSNKNWLGPASQEAIARQIATSYGPSGPNDEYLLRLAAAMREVDFLTCLVPGRLLIECFVVVLPDAPKIASEQPALPILQDLVGPSELMNTCI